MSENVHDRIDRIARDWDGSEPIHPLTAALAHKLAEVLPDRFVAPGSEGEFEFEWSADGGTYIVDVLFLP